MPKYLYPLLAVFSGIIGVFAYSPFNYSGLAFISIFLLLAVIKYAPSTKLALISSFLWGMSYFSFGLNWINISLDQFGGLSITAAYSLVLVLATYLSLFPLLFSWLIRKLAVQQAIIFAILWTFTEFLRGWLFTGFPWLQFGYTQIDTLFCRHCAFLRGSGHHVRHSPGYLRSDLNIIQSLSNKNDRRLLLATSQTFLAIILVVISYYSNKLRLLTRIRTETPYNHVGSRKY